MALRKSNNEITRMELWKSENAYITRNNNGIITCYYVKVIMELPTWHCGKVIMVSLILRVGEVRRSLGKFDGFV